MSPPADADALNPAFWLAAGSLAWNIGLSIFVWLGNGRKELEEKIGAVATDLNGFGQRVATVETKVADGPTHEHLGELHEKMNNAVAVLSRLEGALEQAKELREQERRQRDDDRALWMQIYRKVMSENKP